MLPILNQQLIPLWLLLIFVVSAALSLILCNLARKLFPTFRSGEHKPGMHRSDLSAGGREIKTIELPLVGGPAMTIAIICTGIAAGYLLQFTEFQWTLLLIGLGSTVGYTLVGFIDDWKKVYSNEGLSEKAKFSGVFLVSLTTAALYFFLLPSRGQEPYSPWADLPLLNSVFCAVNPATQAHCLIPPAVAHYGWLICLMVITGVIATLTSLSVDFSDGLDGLAGGLVFSAALALGIVTIGIIDPKHPWGVVLSVLALLCAGSVLGYLPGNWPSAWKARRGSTARRRATIYMGDSGALALGGLLAIIAIFARNELLLLMIGGAFVLEGLSALIQARILTRFFRRNLTILRFADTESPVPHTEFPLPFLATPLHHHFDLLGWDRRRLVYGAWALGAIFALLGVAVSISPLTWQRYLGRILVLLIAAFVWSSGSWSKLYFVGTHHPENHRRSRLALYYGYPLSLMGIHLYHLVEVIEASDGMIETPAEAIALWQRMSIFDARAMLGLYCYRSGYFPAALAQWSSIPERNRRLRPEIERLMLEVDDRLALETQETQPMRRDQIKKPAPLLTGNLQPADLPNPYEPVRSDETETDREEESWASHTGPYPITSIDEQQHITQPLLRDQPLPSSGDGQDQQAEVKQDGNRSGWLSRLFRPME